MHTAAKAALDGWTGPYTTMDGLGGMGGMCWPTVGLLDSLSLQITPIRCCGPLLHQSRRPRQPTASEPTPMDKLSRTSDHCASIGTTNPTNRRSDSHAGSVTRQRSIYRLHT